MLLPLMHAIAVLVLCIHCLIDFNPVLYVYIVIVGPLIFNGVLAETDCTE